MLSLNPFYSKRFCFAFICFGPSCAYEFGTRNTRSVCYRKVKSRIMFFFCWLGLRVWSFVNRLFLVIFLVLLFSSCHRGMALLLSMLSFHVILYVLPMFTGVCAELSALFVSFSCWGLCYNLGREYMFVISLPLRNPSFSHERASSERDMQGLCKANIS